MAAPLARLGKAASNPRELARRAMKNPRWSEELTRGLEADKARIKYGCAKALRIVSQERPELLYPHFDFFVRLLDNENKILQWEAAFVLSQLARVDSDDRFAAIFDKYFSPIIGPTMITAANVIRGGARIGQAKPHLADRIAAEVLKVSRARYQTAECRNVAIGHAILALGDVFDLLNNPRRVLHFVRKQITNSRPATCKKAAQFLKRVQSRAKDFPT
ncbi:MAG: hypothetical protein ACLQM8_20950 [Limisphaerales bacterium]